MVKQLKRKVLVSSIAALALAGSAAVGATAVSGPIFGDGRVSGDRLITVEALGEGGASSAIESRVRTMSFNDIWQDYPFTQPIDPSVEPPISSLSFDVPRKAKQAMVVMRLSAQASCAGTGALSSQDTCNMRLLLDGVPYAITNGTWLTATSSVAARNFSQHTAQEFVYDVAPGKHTVTVQRGILNSSGSTIRFSNGSARLVVEVYEQETKSRNR